MKKTLPLFVLFVLMASTVFAQTPMFFNTNVTAGANTFPLGNTGASRKVQWFIPPNSLGALAPGNNITKVYFQSGSNSNVTYPILTVKLKTGSGTGLTGVAAGPVEPGMTVVYTGVSVPVVTTVGGWLGITLTTPWLYNPALPLIVELEHNGTSGGPTVYQAVSIPGPGNGRQWADYNVANITGVGTNQVNFGVDVIPAVPCSGIPPTNTVLPLSYTTCPGLANPNLSFASTYSFGGLSYQWYESNVSPVGPFTAINGATLSTAPVPTLGVSTWYQAVVTCSAGGGTVTTIAGGEILVAGSTTNTVPYFEGFENIQIPNRLPNCSWAATGTVCGTYTAAAANNRIPNTGTKFAAFAASPSGVKEYYTNGIWMEAGVTYSSGLSFLTESTGALNWSDLSLLVGPNQSTTGLVSFASTNGPAVSVVYKSLSGTFTVPTSGLYYVSVRATGSAGTALYLSWDDLYVTIPCSLNTPSIQITASSNTICEGTSVNLTATGANTYNWNNGATSSSINPSPSFGTSYIVTGTSSLTGCSAQVSTFINVNPAPSVLVFGNPIQSCAGKPVNLVASGANSFVWSTGGIGQNLTVSPLTTTSYSVQGTNALGCIGAGFYTVTVNALPQVNASPATTICIGESTSLSANGALNFKWSSNQTYLIGNPVIVSPVSSVIYTVTGTDALGCEGTAVVGINVNACTSLSKTGDANTDVKLYPNPTNGKLTVELSSSLTNAGLEIVDLTGKVVFVATINQNNTDLSLISLSNGVYFVKIKSNDLVKVLKIVKD